MDKPLINNIYNSIYQNVSHEIWHEGSDLRNISIGILFQKIHLDTYLQYLGLICPYAEYARYDLDIGRNDLDIGRNGYYLFLKHDLGIKWSSFLKQWISQGIKTTTGLSPHIEISNDQLEVTFSERR
ncbi:MAG TPA: hypothetical protein VE089_00140 [Nitrososphaeraceae archaeon]|nr:hypothetical protein [Nitrososphaeraceae archaeon]